MSYFTHAFEAEISRHGVGKTRVVMYKVLFLPPELETGLPYSEYPRLRVEGEIADVPVRGAWIPVGDGRRYFIVSPKVTANTGVDVGDVVEMRFRVDDQNHVDVPDALKLAIDSDLELTRHWDELTAGKKRMFAVHVSSAKTPKTEQKRISEATAAILAGCSIRDLKRK
ncbi:MAG: YdeI/OmpD-associated family protein [Roseibium sp.]|uniref:YdeI/OmpD-associated family protein n=1 Tax=Roseibium sp. TaxID=1936156 RepID=UPI003D9C0118